MKLIYDLSLQDLEDYLVANGYKPYRGKQIFAWLYKRNITSFEEMSDISKELINKLKEDFYIEGLKCVRLQVSTDGTKKYLFELKDGQLIESVMMVFDYGFSGCLSSQVGCNMGCKFCASGLLKKQRDLTVGEIVLQALMINKDLLSEGERLGNIVLMGTGEPFDNYDNVIKALSIINSPYGIEIGARHISVSTCGVVPGIKRFSKENVQYNLAISLHAPTNELRDSLMPINKAYPLEVLFEALKEYSSSNNRRLTFEYLLLKDVNDRYEDVLNLKKLLHGLNAYINLIPYNNVDEMSYKSSDDENALRFYDMLKKAGISVTLRQKRGVDIDAACGQLRAKAVKNA